MVLGFLIGSTYSSFKKSSIRGKKIKLLTLHIEKQKDSVLWLSNELRKHESHIYRMQRIAGIKNPDSVFTWKEKVLHPVNTYNLIHKKDPD